MGRPLTALLSRDAIATAALGLVDRTGGFTIVQVADTLGVRPSSLYNHLSSKAEIVEAMRSWVFREGGDEGGEAETWEQSSARRSAGTARASPDTHASFPW